MKRRETRYGIAELAEAGEVNRRTVRYYVQRGVIPAPLGTGRGRHYTSEHLDALLRARRLQEAGVPLAEIQAPEKVSRLERDTRSETSTDSPLGGRRCRRFRVADGVELTVDESTVINGDELERAVEAVRRILGGNHG